MIKTKNIHSLKRKLTTVNLVFFIVLIFAALGISSKLFIDDALNQAKLHSQYLAQIMVESSRDLIINNKNDALGSNFHLLKLIPYINHVHIYKISEDSQEIEYFSSYNKYGSSIHVKIDEIERLTKPIITANIIEYIAPIEQDGHALGYVYIQTSINHLQTSISNIATITLITILLLLIVFKFFINYLERYISSPMSDVVQQIQKISQLKDFSLRIDNMPYQDLDILARNINILLNGTEKYLKKINDDKNRSVLENKELEEKVNKRNEALKESNQELLSTLEKLHQFQGHLVQSEKMAALGDMVAGVAHEVNTPIGLGITASTLLSDRINDIKLAFEDKTLKSSMLKKFLEEGEENTGIIYRNLQRAANLITNFKKVAVDQSSDNECSFNVKSLFNDMVLTLSPRLKNTQYIINIDCDDELIVKSKPGPINQIIINLILNSIIHGFEDRGYGQINIKISFLAQQLHIDYEDNGLGIDKKVKKKIFDPFVTTKRGAGGSGLGLHLVYNLVTQGLGGSITFTSKLTEGTTFHISFPTKTNEKQLN